MAKNRKKKPKNFYIVILIITIVILTWINYNSKQLEVLYSDNYKETYEANAVIIRNETTAVLQDKVNFSVKSGERVSMNQEIIDSANINFTEYNNRKIDIINWLLENEAYVDKNLFNKDLEQISDNIKKLDEDIDWAESFNKGKVEELKSKREKLVEKESLILNSFQYIGTDKDELLKLKEDYSSKEDNTGSSITPKKLDLNFPGYIYFEFDGYENLLDINVLKYITPEYLSKLDEYNKNQSDDKGQAVKVVDDSFMYLAVTAPQNLTLPNEKQVVERKEDIMSSIDSTDLMDYYQYLNSRVDILKTLPGISYEYGDKVYFGYIVDIREFGEEKIVLIELKDHLCKDFFNKRTVDIDLVTYSGKGYIVPKKSVIKVDKKDNLVILHKGFLKKQIEVEVTRENGDLLFLDESKNDNIVDGMQIILNP